MVLPQEIPIIKNIIQYFSREFGTKINYNEEENIIANLKLENKDSIEKGLFYSLFILFREKGYQLNLCLDLNSTGKKVEDSAKKLFKNCKFHKIGEDFLLVISTKFINSFDTEGKAVKACQKNEVAILDYKTKRFFAQSQRVINKFKSFLYSNNESPKKVEPQKVNSNFLSKIFTSKEILIYEVEFHNLHEPEILNFYLKAGSKQSSISPKIKKITKDIFSDFGAYNLKSILLSTKTNIKKRLRLSLIEDRFGVYKLIIPAKNPDPSLKRELEVVLAKDNIKLNYPIKFTDEDTETIVIKLMNKKKILGYNQEYKEDINKWDKNKLVHFSNNRLIVNETNVIKAIETLTKKDFDILPNKILQISNIKIKGHLLIRKSDRKSIFFFLRKSPKDSERLKQISLDTRIPFFYIETKDNNEIYDQRFIFTSLNKLKDDEFIFLINKVLDDPQLYKNLKNNYIWANDKLKSVKRFLLRKNPQKKGHDWEMICNSLLNYLFMESFPLGRSYLPDGITFFTEKESIIWDAKALNSKCSYLNQSVKTKDRRNIKDTFYIDVFKEKGPSFDFYTYLVVGVKKEDFEKVKKKIIKYLNRKRINLEISCITESWLRGLSEYISTGDNLIRLQKNKEALLKKFKEELKKGYLDQFDKNKFDEIGKNLLPLNLTQIRQDIKTKMDS